MVECLNRSSSSVCSTSTTINDTSSSGSSANSVAVLHLAASQHASSSNVSSKTKQAAQFYLLKAVDALVHEDSSSDTKSVEHMQLLLDIFRDCLQPPRVFAIDVRYAIITLYDFLSLVCAVNLLLKPFFPFQSYVVGTCVQ
jgi:hypothetical protein